MDNCSKQDRDKYYDRKVELQVEKALEQHVKSGFRPFSGSRNKGEISAKRKNGERDVLIRLSGVQSEGEASGDKITLTTHGKYFKNNNVHTIVYSEPEEYGFPGTVTTLTYCEDGSASLKREGGAEMELVFKNGMKEIAHYSTPAGDVELGFFTNSVDFEINDRGGKIFLSYNVSQGTEFEFNTRLDMKFSFI